MGLSLYNVILWCQKCRGDRPVAPTSYFRHRMFRKHPMSFHKEVGDSKIAAPEQLLKNRFNPNYPIETSKGEKNYRYFQRKQC